MTIKEIEAWIEEERRVIDDNSTVDNFIIMRILIEILRELQSQRPKLANAKIRYQNPPDTSSNR